MAYGVTKLRKIQYGRESTPGTQAAATYIHRGEAAGIKDDSPYTLVNENVGYLMQTDRGYFGSVAASLDVPEHPATFEGILHLFEAGIKTVSPTGNGGTTTANIYTYPLLSTAGAFVLVGSSSNPIKPYTVEAGDNNAAYYMAFAYIEQIDLTFAPKEAVKVTCKWVGRQKLTATFTAALSPTAQEEILMLNGKLYVDDTGGTIGTTQKTGTWLGGKLSLKTGWQPIYTGEGNLYYVGIKNVGPELTGSITYEYDTTGSTAEAKFAAGTTQLVRMTFPGSALSGSGGTYSTKLFRFDAAVKYTDVEAIGSDNGDDTVTVNFSAVQGNSGQATPTFTVCNLLNAVP